MSEVEHIGHRGRVVTRSGLNVVEAVDLRSKNLRRQYLNKNLRQWD